MKKKYVIIIGVVLSALAFHACEIPTTIELKAKPSISLPLNPNSVNISQLLSDTVKDIFPADGAFQFHIFSNFPADREKKIQSFLLYYPVVENKELDLNKRLNVINDDAFSAAKGSFSSPDITIPDFQFNSGPMTSDIIIFGGSFSPPSFQPPLPAIGDPSDFETVVFDTGSKIQLVVKLDKNGNTTDLSDVRLDLSNIKIIIQIPGGGSIDIPASGGDFSLMGDSPHTVAFDLANREIPAGSTMNFNATFTDASAPMPAPKEAKMSITPTFENITLARITKDISSYNLAVDPIPISLKDAAEYVEWIEFDGYETSNPTEGVGVKLLFDQADIRGMGIKITCAELEMNGDIQEIKPAGAANPIIFKNAAPVRLLIDESTELELQIEMGPLQYNEASDSYLPQFAGNNIMTITPQPGQTLGPNGTKRIKGKAGEMIRDWTKAQMNLDGTSLVKGEYPDGSGEPLDVSKLNTYLDREFRFMDIEARLFISGPTSFSSMNPHLKLEANTQNEPLFDDNLTLGDRKPELHYENGENSPVNQMPQGGADLSDVFDEVLNGRPSSLSFIYDVSLANSMIITPDMFESDEVTALDVIVVIMLPLRLKAGPNGASINFPETVKGKADLFDRKKSGDSSVLDMIKKFSLNVGMTDTVLSGGELFMKDGQHKFSFPLNDANLRLSITGADLEYINRTFPYKPDMGIGFEKNTTLEIPVGLGAIEVGFDAEIDYRYQL
jgi:hypothetical protein